MTGIDVCDFIANHSSGVLSLAPLEKSIAFFDKLIEKNQVIFKFNRRKLVGVAAYYRTNDPLKEIQSTEEWSLPEDYDNGMYVFIDQVVVHKDYRHTGIIKEFEKRLRNLTPIFHSALWLEDDGKWRIEERSQNMQTNCGVIAFDKIAGELNGRANVISLSTLTRMALDNEFLMFPMRVKTEDLYRLPIPFVLHNDFHFEAVRSHESILPLAVWNKEYSYVLSQTDEVGELLDDDEAKLIKGSKGKKFFKQIFLPFIDPLNTLAIRTDAGGNHYPFAGAGNTIAATLGGAATGGPLGAITGALGSSLIGAKNGPQPFSIGGALTSGLGGAVGGLLGGLGGGAGSSLGNIAKAGGSSSLLGSFLPPGVGAASSTVTGSSGGGLGSILGNLIGIGGSGGGIGSGFGSGGGSGGVANTGGALSGILEKLNPFGGGSAGQQANSLFGSPNFGTLLGGGLLAKGLLSPQPSLHMPESLDQLQALANAQANGGGLSPAGNSAYSELNRGIQAGPSGIYPAAGDQYIDAALGQNRRIADRGRETLLNDINRIGGGVYSSNAQQQLSNYDESQRIAEQEWIQKYTEMARQQGQQAHQKYIELALQGDQQSYMLLAQSLGSIANADIAIQAFQAGLADGKSKQFTDLGGQLLGQSLDPHRQYATGSLLGGKNEGMD